VGSEPKGPMAQRAKIGRPLARTLLVRLQDKPCSMSQTGN